MTTKAIGISLLDHFFALEDLRQAWKVRYLPPEALILVVYATPTGDDAFVEFEAWSEEPLDLVRRLGHVCKWVVEGTDEPIFGACTEAT